ncbi:MAG: DMT family transporter [Chloroflexi bacterium]|nr:MAG: DMT family transporter [Chloroflexota bacterium]
MSRHPRRASSSDLLVLSAICVWSVNVIVVKVALDAVDPLVYTAARFLLGGTLLLSVVRLHRSESGRPPLRDLGAMALAGLFGIAANQTAFTVSLRYTTAVDVSLILGATPLVVAAYGALLSSERIGARAWSGMLVGAAGLVLVVGAGGGAHGQIGGDLIALGAPLVWAFYVTRLVDLLPRYQPLVLSGWVTILGALPLLPVAAAQAATAPPRLSWQLLGFFAFSTVMAVGWCNLAFYIGLEHLGATRAAVYGYLQPFLGAVVAFLALGETLRPLQLAGGVVVIAGVVVGRPRPAPVAALQAPVPAPNPALAEPA